MPMFKQITRWTSVTHMIVPAMMLVFALNIESTHAQLPTELTSAEAPAVLSGYETRYEVIRGGSHYGEAIRSLEKRDGQYKLYTETEISLLFLSDRRRFWSEFELTDGRIRSHVFTYKRSGTGRDKGISVDFDWATQQLINREKGQLTDINIHEYSMDEAANIEQLRLDIQQTERNEFTYQIIDEKGQADTLRFRRVGQEQLTLPYGNVNAVKVERVRDASKRETDYWFAPELDYVLVKMAQREDGDEVATLQLSHIEIAN